DERPLAGQAVRADDVGEGLRWNARDRFGAARELDPSRGAGPRQRAGPTLARDRALESDDLARGPHALDHGDRGAREVERGRQVVLLARQLVEAHGRSALARSDAQAQRHVAAV